MAQTEHAFDQPIGGGDLSLKTAAASDLSAKQYFGCKLDADGHVVLAAAGEAIFISQDKPIGGRVGKFRMCGVSYAHFGDAVAPGDRVTTDADGKIVAATAQTSNVGTGATTGSDVLGICIIGGAEDEIGSIFVLPGGAIPGTLA